MFLFAGLVTVYLLGCVDLKKENDPSVFSIEIDAKNQIRFNQLLIPLTRLESKIIAYKLNFNPEEQEQLQVKLRIDLKAKMGTVSDVQQILRAIKIRNIIYSSPE